MHTIVVVTDTQVYYYIDASCPLNHAYTNTVEYVTALLFIKRLSIVAVHERVSLNIGGASLSAKL